MKTESKIKIPDVPQPRIPRVVGTLLIAAGLALAVAIVWLSDKYVVPIVMYHNVEESQEAQADTVSPENFRLQMEFLKSHGYRVITMDMLVEMTRQGKMPPYKSVVLTFDDGYENNYVNAFPILQEYRYPATMFISPDFISQAGFLNWKQVDEMKEYGIRFGSHGMTQAYLPELDKNGRVYEIEESKRVLEARLNVPVNYLAYPVGGFSDEIKDHLKRAGYQAALATNRGWDRFNRDLFELNRIRFSDKDRSPVILWAKLSGYYNLFRKLKKPY